MKKPTSEKVSKVISTIVFWALLISAAYAIINMIIAPSGMSNDTDHAKTDYSLILIQCLLGIGVMFLPQALEKRFKIKVPNVMHILFVLFLYAAIILGEVRNFYYLVPHWDVILHTFSGGMLGSIGFSVVQILNNAEKTKINLSPLFVALFAFCFAVALGTLWEIYEFTVDALFNLNMQKYALQTGKLLAGRNALGDTMKDLIVDTIGALAVSVFGFLGLKRGNNKKYEL